MAIADYIFNIILFINAMYVYHIQIVIGRKKRIRISHK